jgi:hypothetical protein
MPSKLTPEQAKDAHYSWIYGRTSLSDLAKELGVSASTVKRAIDKHIASRPARRRPPQTLAVEPRDDWHRRWFNANSQIDPRAAGYTPVSDAAGRPNVRVVGRQLNGEPQVAVLWEMPAAIYAARQMAEQALIVDPVISIPARYISERPHALRDAAFDHGAVINDGWPREVHHRWRRFSWASGDNWKRLVIRIRPRLDLYMRIGWKPWRFDFVFQTPESLAREWGHGQ